MAAADNTQQVVEEKLVTQTEHHEFFPIQQQAFNRRHSLTTDGLPKEARRGSVESLKKSFDATNIQMTLPVQGHLEMTDDYAEGNSIDDIAVSWFVWLVAATASIAGMLFGYDTGMTCEVAGKYVC